MPGAGSYLEKRVRYTVFFLAPIDGDVFPHKHRHEHTTQHDFELLIALLVSSFHF